VSILGLADPFTETAIPDEPADEMRMPIIHIQLEAVWVGEILAAQCPNAIRLLPGELPLVKRDRLWSAGKG
jgi:hypothetical protein